MNVRAWFQQQRTRDIEYELAEARERVALLELQLSE